VTEFNNYKYTDSIPDTYGVEPVNYGLIYQFKPWYNNGKTIYWGTVYPLKSEAQSAALKLQQQFKNNDNSNSLKSETQK
tara:strand:+ start:4142 stop:4378 length:237 start_codon:yes stop_codon:yes gene_type:complete